MAGKHLEPAAQFELQQGSQDGSRRQLAAPHELVDLGRIAAEILQDATSNDV